MFILCNFLSIIILLHIRNNYTDNNLKNLDFIKFLNIKKEKSVCYKQV